MDEGKILFQGGQIIQKNQPESPVQEVSSPPDQGGDDNYSEPEEGGFFSLISFSSVIKIVIGLIVVIIIVVGVIFFISSRSTELNKNEKVTLNYWGLWEDARVMQPIIDEFKKQYPNITVNYSKQDPKQYRERLTTRIQNGSGPDLFRFHNTWLPMLMQYLLPLSSDVISKDDFKKNYYPVVGTDLTKNGAIYGIPLGIDTLALFVNTDILKSAGLPIPTTWEDFANTAIAVTVKDESGKIKVAGAALGTYDNIEHAPDIISLFMVQNGANLKNPNLTPQKTIDALKFYTGFASGQGGVWDSTLDPSLIAFAKGNLAMYFGYSYDVFIIKAMNPDLNFQVVPVPKLSDRKTTIASYWVEGVSSKSKYQKEALLFLKFLEKKETQQKLFLEESKTRLFGEPYARVDLLESLKGNDLAYVFASQAKDAVSTYFSANTYDEGLNDHLNGYLGNAVRSILSNTSAETALETLSKGITEILQRYGQ